MEDSFMVTIKIILGSRRPGRFGIQPAAWITELGAQYADKARFELVDLQELDLPFLDESVPASMNGGVYEHEHSQKWSKIVDEADGFIFVSPEYNHSYSPTLKNAIDYLYREWNYKPVSFVNYGAAAGGVYSTEHLRNVAAWLKMYDLSEQLFIPHYYNNMDENGAFKFDEDHERRAKALIEQNIFWAEAMKPAREALKTQEQ